MKKYTKPCLNVIELQLKENIAAAKIATTVYKGSVASGADLLSLALSETGIDLSNANIPTA